MKFRIEEHLEEKYSDQTYSTPKTYRIALELKKDEIVLKREYFYTGYNDGEQIDGFYFNNEVSWSKDDDDLVRATFLTRNFDPEYLKLNEKKLLDKFYERLVQNENYLIKKLKKTTDYIKKDIQSYKDYQNCDIFLKMKREKKLKEINEKNN